MLKFAAFCVLCLELHYSSFHFIVSIDFIIFSIKHSICSRKNRLFRQNIPENCMILLLTIVQIIEIIWSAMPTQSIDPSDLP